MTVRESAPTRSRCTRARSSRRASGDPARRAVARSRAPPRECFELQAPGCALEQVLPHRDHAIGPRTCRRPSRTDPRSRIVDTLGDSASRGTGGGVPGPGDRTPPGACTTTCRVTCRYLVRMQHRTAVRGAVPSTAQWRHRRQLLGGCPGLSGAHRVARSRCFGDAGAPPPGGLSPMFHPGHIESLLALARANRLAQPVLKEPPINNRPPTRGQR